MHLGSTLLVLMLSAGPAEVEVRPGETLPQVAKRALGDETAAAELKALNGLSGDAVAPGTKLKLPGPERDAAAKALETARASVAQARDVPEAKRQQAQQKLKEAEALLAQARYAEVQKAADEAWQLVSEGKDTRFSVQVTPDGQTTTVTSTQGVPVQVESSGVVKAVHPGQTARVQKGKAPEEPVATLTPPALVKPAHQARLERKPTKQGLGPVVLAWHPVEGAARYEVVVKTEEGAEVVKQTVPKPELTLQTLQEGRYQWTVRSLADGRQSELAEPRDFELVRNLKISAKASPWK